VQWTNQPRRSRSAKTGRKEEVMKNKQELIDYVAHQVNVRLENNLNSALNSNKKALYTTITRNNRNAVLGILNRKGIRYEEHIKDNYFIYI
jgi:hypothetical protein